MNGMRVTVEMGQEEFIAFVNFQKERPQLLTAAKRLDEALSELAEAVNEAISDDCGNIKVNFEAARELLRLAGKYL